MRYYVFNTHTEAEEIAGRIDANARSALAAAGYTVREDGGILGKRYGIDDPGAVTTAWDVPRQRLDGQWVLQHPETHPAAGVVTDNGLMLDRLTDGLGGLTTETKTPDWWPAPDPV
ncbi:hypothetical protein HDIA_4472 [Hartmannibacter diazotrophicus]|uniref:Uncharacterized protein n=1 Tax=Hartmannibacter diazotrophicus TaxID=1482074 RepID=A0A2C9DCQ4_9HYPH|nr:hypothetical protein [Hartmannibacter diazotrophicus]SON58013.1 hypothetical protein HDIA_4472 [Hartmannibacter diazotrophicus]